MPYYETAYPSLLFGISQQLPQHRQPGQLNEQLNMVSDLVRGLCRRPGSKLIATLPDSAVDYQYINTKVGGRDVLLELNPSDTLNPIKARDARNAFDIPVVLTGSADTWCEDLLTNSRFQSATVGQESILICPDVPVETITNTPTLDSSKAGYFYVPTGAYSQEYALRVHDITANVTYSASYVTPDGTSGTHVPQSTPSYIANELATDLIAALPGSYSVFIDGAYVYISSTTQAFEVLTDTSETYLQVSNKSQVQSTNILPARLPAQADGYTVRIGNSAVALHFRYSAAQRAWLEDADPTKRVSVRGLGLRLSYDGANINVDRLDSKPRAAGNDISNPELNIVNGITGVAAFQGRLVLLADQYVCMSAVGDPTIWFRTSVTGLVDSDPIEIALTTAYPSPYKSGVEFNGNLLVLSDSHQVQIPGDIPITPTNATLALVANYGIRSEYAAFPLGRSLLMPTNTNSGYVGFVEALPPENLEAMLRATDITSHIPTLMQGVLIYASASHTADTVVCGLGGSDDISNFVYVHQYMWAGVEKKHSAWHKWRFQYPVRHAYFLADVLYLVSQYNDKRNLCTIDLRRGQTPAYYLDYAKEANVFSLTTGGETYNVVDVSINDNYDGLETTLIRAFKLAGTDGVRLGEDPAIVTSGGGTQRFSVYGAVGDRYVVGFPFLSEISPTAPIIKDRSDKFLASEHIPLVKFKAQVYNTGAITVRINDRAWDSGEFDAPIVPYSALQTLGNVPLENTGTVIIPSRTEARDTTLRLWTSDYYDMNITNLEYGFKLGLKFRRA